MLRRENNYAFIDGQNLYLGIKALGWRLDYQKFRRYLREKYSVNKAYLFIGYIATNESLYQKLVIADFILVFKPVISGSDGKRKGNIDADLVVKAMAELDQYDKALIVSGDGDFYSLVGYLQSLGKLRAVLSPNLNGCSRLLRETTASGKIWFMDHLRLHLEHSNKKYTLSDVPFKKGTA